MRVAGKTEPRNLSTLQEYINSRDVTLDAGNAGAQKRANTRTAGWTEHTLAVSRMGAQILRDGLTTAERAALRGKQERPTIPLVQLFSTMDG